MNKEEYFEISTKKELPMRCPILNYCERRAWTIYHNSDYAKFFPGMSMQQALLKDNELPSDFITKKIDVQGEAPSWIYGKSFSCFNGMCPEVNLFDNEHTLFPNQACVAAEYDDSYKEPKNRVLKTQHYSECAEFNKYVFELKMKGKSTTNSRKPRKSIPAKTRAILQKEIKSKCPICSNEDVEHFHIHHIDENPLNNEFENLLMLCPNCHSKITKNDIVYETVKLIKENLSS